jgi:DNA-binding CsgD family transcriptional regulator
LVVVDRAPLVERERELEALERLLSAARAGRGRAVVVEGAPGIGKSSLLAAARAAAGDLRVVVARGGELEREFGFGIVRQLLEPVLVAADEAGREALLAGAAELAEPVLLAPDDDGGAEPAFSALHGLYWLAINLAGVRPLLLVVDDVQWADLASLRWLVYLARRLEGVPLALLLASRPVAAGAERELLDELVTVAEVEVLYPSDLSERAVGGLAVGRLAAAPDPEFVAACHRATGGNPFLLGELFGELLRRGVAPSRVNAEVASRLSSQGVGRAVRGRLRRLGSECASLARAVAVLGDPAELTVAARVAGLDDALASAAADRLAEALILEPGRPLAFVHALVRSSVEAELSAGERAREHGRAAAVLAAAGAAADRIALHLLESEPRGDAETVDTLRRAAASAGGRGAPEVAVSYLRRALAEPPSAELLPAVAHELGAAALRAGDGELGIARLREAVRGLGDPGVRARAANALGSALFQAYRGPEAVAELTTVIDELPDGEREHGLRLQATRWIGAIGSVAAWRALPATPERFLVTDSAARTSGERLGLMTAAFDAVRTRTVAEARELCLRALAGGRLLDDPGPESAAFWGPPVGLLLAHALAELTSVCDEVIAWAERHGSLPAFSIAVQLRAYAGWRRGSLADAEADATSAFAHPVVPGFPAFGSEALANVLLARGDLDGAEAARPPAPSELSGVRAFWHLDTRARVRAASQQVEQALEDLFACGQLEHDWQIRTPAFSGWRADAAPLLASLGRREEADRLAREELERSRAFGATGPLGVALRSLGLVTPGAAGITLLEQAVATLAGSPARLEHALALLELGAATRRAGRRTAARQPLREALELARGCGADAVAARAHDELVAAGARPRRDPTESRTNLTAGELRVARLAADGLTNREIAQALFLTENTIETHLRSAYSKLDIGSRSQLPRALAPQRST